MRCTCAKKSHATPKLAMIALARCVAARQMGDNRLEVRFYPCPSGNGFHLTSEAASSFDSSTFVKLSRMVCLNAERILTAG